MKNNFWPYLKWVALLALMILSAAPARGQWLTQAITLRPGWNAVYLHVNATNNTLENLAGASSPISEIWLWQPSLSTGRIFSSPLQPVSGSDWMQWTKATGPANAFPLRANSTYLVRNSGATVFSWNLKGVPVPPESRWSASGLNFFGFSTRSDSAPVMANFLAPAQSSTPFDIFYYPGGEAAGASPNTAPLFSLNTVPVARGQAFWIKKQDNSENRYFGTFEVTLQDYRGIGFSDSRGSYSLRLRNQTATTNNITATLLASETTPSGQTVPAPPLLLRTALDTSTLKYGSTNLPLSQARTFTLAPKGKPGSEVEVVIGLDRANMAGAAGTLFAAVLRLQDTTLGHLQIDLPVTATQGSTEGLWVGNASIKQVGNYLKTYAKATNATDFANQLTNLTLLNEGNKTVSFPAGLWNAHSATSSAPAIVTTNHNWAAVASSEDGARLVAASRGSQIFTSSDYGATWTPQTNSPSTNWQAVASSADGGRLVAVVQGGQIYTSGDWGTNWLARNPSANWQSVASSSNGVNLVAVIGLGNIYTSGDAGATWTQRIPLSNQNWRSVASSSDGTTLLAAIQGGQLYASTNAGTNWTALFGAPIAPWQSVASSADGKTLIAVAKPGGVYISTDSGATWDLKASAPPGANWQAVSASANGKTLVAAESGGKIYTSSDEGTTWTAREENRAWTATASSADGTRLIAGETGGTNQLYTVIGDLITPTLTYDTNSNLILSGGGKYLTASFDTELGDVTHPFSLRLIVHQGTAGAKLLQRVYVGPELLTTNTILTLDETKLHPAFLARSRRISAVHLPLSNSGWALSGAFGGVGIMNATLSDGFGNHTSNPFLHSYHPDHDNLDALFQPISKAGSESYDIKRQITLSFTPPGDDFASRTVGGARVQGTYLENIILKGSDNQTRTIVTKGDFTLNRVSSIATLK